MTCLAELDTICAMWRRLHVLSPVQSLVVASVSAATIALPLAAQLVSRNERALLRSLFWPDTINPYMTFSFVFIGVVPTLLGYYHLGRLGLLLNIGAGFALAWIMAVCGMLCFAFVGHLSGSAWLSTVAYRSAIDDASITLPVFLPSAAHTIPREPLEHLRPRARSVTPAAIAGLMRSVR
jgi:hypothetical protein